MRKHRVTYMPTTMFENVAWVQGKRIQDINSLTVMNSECDYVLPSVLKMLYCVVKEKQLTYSDLFYKSGFRMKKTYHRYLDFCRILGFIEREETRQGAKRYYNITEKGRILWGLFANNA